VPAASLFSVPMRCFMVPAHAVLYGASTSLPGLLQSLFGYNALQTGLVMSPAGVFAVLAMPVVAFVLGRRTDARWLILAGLLLMAAGNYWMSQLNLDISYRLSGPGSS
jgi:MFS transporter, DHA2 family, multidrug resistance protein